MTPATRVPPPPASDEGHKLKNPRMQLRKALDALPCALRVIISGTPIQVPKGLQWEGCIGG